MVRCVPGRRDRLEDQPTDLDAIAVAESVVRNYEPATRGSEEAGSARHELGAARHEVGVRVRVGGVRDA